MKKILFSLFAFASVLSAVSCNKEIKPYDPAPVPSGDQVYFMKGDYDYNLGEYGHDTIFIDMARVNAEKAAQYSLTVACDTLEAAFSLPKAVSFEAKGKQSQILVIIDKNKLPLDEPVSISFSVAEKDATPYGLDNITLSVVNKLPEEWHDLYKGSFTESKGFWNETEPKTLKYMEVSEDLWFCKLPECFGYETKKKGEDYPVQDYTFYWNKKTNKLYVVSGWMGYTDSGVDIYFATEADWYLKKKGLLDLTPGTAEWFDAMDKGYEAYGTGYVPYYDGNGGFYLADCYICDLRGAYAGSAYYWDGTPDLFVADGFVRTTDYNKLEYTTISLGTDYSKVWDETFDIAFAVAEDPDAVEDVESYIAYIPEYFKEESGLAFIVSAKDTTGLNYEIKDGKNPQYTGKMIFGKELVANIVGRKSSMQLPENGETYPIIIKLCVNLDLYVTETDEEGNEKKVKDSSFGEFVDSLVLTSDAWYSADKLLGTAKANYVGDYLVTGTNYSGSDNTWAAKVTDAGVISEMDMLCFENLIPYTTVLDNKLYVEWYNGYLYFMKQESGPVFVYQDEEYPLSIYTFDGEYYYDNQYLIGGLAEVIPEVLYMIVFTNDSYDNDYEVNGLYFYISEQECLDYLMNIAMLPFTEPTAVNKPTAPKQFIPSRWQVLDYANVCKMKAASKKFHAAVDAKLAERPAKFDKALKSMKTVKINHTTDIFSGKLEQKSLKAARPAQMHK